MRRIVCVVLVSVLWQLSSVAQATTVGLSNTIMFPGQFKESILRIGGLGGSGISPHLGAFDLDIGFDPDIITLFSVTFQDGRFNSSLGDPNFRTFTIPAPLVPSQPGAGEALALATLFPASSDSQTVNLLELSFLPADDPLLDQQGSSFILAVLRFGGLRLGTSELNIKINELNPIKGLSDEFGNSLPVSSYVNGSVSVIDVPEIDTSSGNVAICLLFGALALLGERRRRPKPETAG